MTKTAFFHLELWGNPGESTVLTTPAAFWDGGFSPPGRVRLAFNGFRPWWGCFAYFYDFGSFGPVHPAAHGVLRMSAVIVLNRS